MKVTASVLEVVEGLKGEALRKAKATGLYDKFVKDKHELDHTPLDPSKLPPLPERFMPPKSGGAFDDLEDDIPWS